MKMESLIDERNNFLRNILFQIYKKATLLPFQNERWFLNFVAEIVFVFVGLDVQKTSVYL